MSLGTLTSAEGQDKLGEESDGYSPFIQVITNKYTLYRSELRSSLPYTQYHFHFSVNHVQIYMFVIHNKVMHVKLWSIHYIV